MTIEASVSGVAASARCDWTIGERTLKNRPCGGADFIVPLEQDVIVTATPRQGTVRETTVRVRRIVIATFGDSYMSGEGNPHARSRVNPVRSEWWLEPRCHRSLLTASSLAAFRYAEANPRDYVAYFVFACSGSTGDVGLLGPYEGIVSSRGIDNARSPEEPRIHFTGATLPSQVEQATSTFCDKSSCVSPDVIFLSIGINSVGFSQTIGALATGNCDAACRAKEEARVRDRLEAVQADGPGSLRNAYGELNRALSPRIAFAVEYPDPTRGENGQFCDGNMLFPVLGRFKFGRVDATENSWAHDILVEPLNQAIARTAESMPPWRYLGGPAETTQRHGFCADKTFFNSAQASRGTTGTMHPNPAGHDAIADVMLRALKESLPARR